MKSLILKMALLSTTSIFFLGCVSSPVVGMVYTGTKHSGIGVGGVVDNNVKIKKVGTSECSSILSLFAFGDCSIESAKNSAGITKVNSVEHKATNILYFYSNYTTIVKGE